MGNSGSGTGTPIGAGGVPGLSYFTPQEYPVLSLEEFRRILQYHPAHFWGLADTGANAVVPVTSNCNAIVKQYGWQDTDAAGRAEIAEAILSAEHKLSDYLGYYPAPHYIEETIPYARFLDSRFWRGGSADADGRWAAVRVKEQLVQDVGVETLTSIGSVNLALSDEDGDGLDDTWTASIATTVTDADEIAVYFAAADRYLDETVGERWRIQPVEVKITGGVCYLRGPAWILVKPALYEPPGLEAIDPTAAGNFITTVEVYRRYTSGNGNTEATAQGLFTWETPPYPESCCGDSNLTFNGTETDPASIATAIARVGIRDARTGLLIPGTAVYASGMWSAVTWGTCRPPDRVTIRYRAGYPMQNGHMDKKLQVLVARLAMAELARPICGCDEANRELYRWQKDLAQSGANDEVYNVSPADLDNPFGTRRGHIEAWKQVRKLKQVRGLAA